MHGGDEIVNGLQRHGSSSSVIGALGPRRPGTGRREVVGDLQNREFGPRAVGLVRICMT
jgi:hypothetical protein